MPINYTRINSFIAAEPIRQEIAYVLRRTGFEITWVGEQRNRQWFFYARPNKVLQEVLVLSNQEVLIWYAEHDDFQARTVSSAQRELETDEMRLSREFVLIITPAVNTKDEVQAIGGLSETAFIGFSTQEFLEIKQRMIEDQERNAFLFELRRSFFQRDPYWMTPAIRSASHFYGRKELLQEIVQLLANTGTHVGLFGLRKMGKTSFLYRLIDILRSRQTAVCHLDMQLVDSIKSDSAYFFWSLGEAIYDAVKRRLRSGFRLFGSAATFADIDNPSAILEYFRHDLSLVLENTHYKIVIAIDEFELMSPNTPGSSWSPSDFVRIWRLLRGISQQYPGRIVFFVTGTNPQIIETNRIIDTDNPIYNYFDIRYLPPLAKKDSDELLNKYGKRIGLHWTDEVVSELHARVGGHPFLLRAYASEVYKQSNVFDEFSYVTLDDIRQTAEKFYRTVSPHLSQMVEVLNDYYEDEYMLMEMLAVGDVAQFREYRNAFPNELGHLEGYGLVNADGGSAALAIDVLQAWIQNRAKQRSKSHPSISNIQSLLAGSNFLNYEIIAQIGHHGGFSKVFKAKNLQEPDEFVAVKILENASLANLQREVAVLENATHPNIVRLLDYGKSDTGLVYLIMEYLEGRSLRERCNRLQRLTEAEAIEITLRLLQALASIHPKESFIRQMRAKGELTPEEFIELERARHGYVHRDIKPENIILVPTRGPVLIDFNISSLASIPIRTMSHTPHYLPPEGLSGNWNAKVDLYQLGITMLQACAGMEYSGDNLDNIRSIVSSEYSPRTFAALNKLCAANPDVRYPTTEIAEKAIEGLYISIIS